MNVLWLNLFVVFIASVVSTIFSKQIIREYTCNGSIENREFIKPNKFWAFIALASLVLVAGLRLPIGYGVIGDTGMYSHSFNLISPDFFKAISKLSLEDDVGFNFLSVVIKFFISDDPQVFIFIVAFITNVLIFITLYNYAKPFYIGPYLYITWGAFLVSMNGMRQYLAGSILFVFTKLLLDGKTKLFFVVVLFAALIHTSALIYIPIYFIIREKAWSKKTGWMIFTTVFVFAFFSLLMPAFFAVLGGTKYGHYQSTFEGSYGGANVVRVIVAAVPVIFAYYSRVNMNKMWDKIDVFVNFSLLNLIFMLFSTYNWIFARMSVYFNLYNFILLPFVVAGMFKNEKLRALVYYLLIVLFLIYYYYEMVISLNLRYRSNFINF